jgi:hypothetical protein
VACTAFTSKPLLFKKSLDAAVSLDSSSCQLPVNLHAELFIFRFLFKSIFLPDPHGCGRHPELVDGHWTTGFHPLFFSPVGLNVRELVHGHWEHQNPFSQLRHLVEINRFPIPVLPQGR